MISVDVGMEYITGSKNGHIINDLLTSLAQPVCKNIRARSSLYETSLSVLSRPGSDIFSYRPRTRLIIS